MSVFLAAALVTIVARAFLPEGAGRSLEEIAGEPEPGVPPVPMET